MNTHVHPHFKHAFPKPHTYTHAGALVGSPWSKRQTLHIHPLALKIHMHAGALVGPPWSKRQNGVTFREAETADGSHASLYFEPHCDFAEASVAKLGT